MMPLRIFIWSILCVAAFVMGQSDPIDISTAGASQLRLRGQLTLSRNPASLGYSVSARPSEPSIDDTLSIKTFVEPDSIDTTSTMTLPVDTLAMDSLSVEPQDTSFFTDDIYWMSSSMRLATWSMRLTIPVGLILYRYS